MNEVHRERKPREKHHNGTFCEILPPSGKKYLQGGDDVAIIHVIENDLQTFANFQNETNAERTLRV